MSRVGWSLRRVWFWIEGHGLVIVMLLSLAVGVGTPLGLRAEQNARQHDAAAALTREQAAFERQATESRRQVCDYAAGQQEVIRTLIDVSLASGSSPDLSRIVELPSFAAMPESVQAFFRDLVSPSPSPDQPPGDSIEDRLRRFQRDRLGPDDLPAYCQELADVDR